MKSHIAKIPKVETTNKITSYPAIGKSGELVVFFCSESVGMIIHPSDHYSLGKYEENWNMNQFCLLPDTEKIELSN